MRENDVIIPAVVAISIYDEFPEHNLDGSTRLIPCKVDTDGALVNLNIEGYVIPVEDWDMVRAFMAMSGQPEHHIENVKKYFGMTEDFDKRLKVFKAKYDIDEPMDVIESDIADADDSCWEYVRSLDEVKTPCKH